MTTGTNEPSLTEAQLDRLDTIMKQELWEEAAIVSCCYLVGLARNRFASLRSRDDMHLFTLLLRQHSNRSDIFDKISRVEITCRTADDPCSPKALKQHATVTTAILAKFGNEVDTANDPTEADLLQTLSGIPQLDIENLRASLWRYSYGATLYRQWLESGRHPLTLGNYTSPPDVSYNLYNRLTFSAILLIDTLKEIAVSLRTELECP